METLFEQLGVQLGIAGVALAITYFVLKHYAKQYDKTVDLLIQVIKENSAEMAKNAASKSEVIRCIDGNTAALKAIEDAINGLPRFVEQVDRRLENGRQRFADHERRLKKLEHEEVTE